LILEYNHQANQHTTSKHHDDEHSFQFHSHIGNKKNIANTSAQGKYANSTESGIQDGSNQSENHPVSQQGAISGLSNVKIKMEEIDREWAAFKIEQSKL
jgi:hypothetical protein